MGNILKGMNKKPYMVTVAHYFAVDDGSFFSQTMDIGLSVMVKIQTSTEVGMKITLEGLENQPSASLCKYSEAT